MTKDKAEQMAIAIQLIITQKKLSELGLIDMSREFEERALKLLEDI